VFLVTADLQAEWSTLDLCEQAWEEILHICLKRHIKIIVFCGDGKEAYDPVSIRVIKFWQHAIHTAYKLGIVVYYLRGNHDRIATYSEAGDWLSILKRAGAITFSSPGVVKVDDHRFFFLPFAKVKTIKKWAKDLLKHKPDRRKDVLFFHANLLEARYSQHGQQSDSTLSIDDLYHNHFRYVIGADIHLPQKIEENVYYVGSPFCNDWGEVNQRKRYLVVGVDGIQSIHSRIPRWYDPSVGGFETSLPKSWDGARIRITVPCDVAEDYGRRIEKVRRRAEKKYKGAELYVIPKFEGGETTEGSTIKMGETDERKIKEYISSTRLSKQVHKSMAIEYMLEKLSHFSHGLRTGSKFKFKWAKARNYLSFEKVKFDFKQKGIIVVKGVNQDRGNKSNGSGKTSLTNLIPVAWFGKTFKGQAHDRWSNRFHPKDQAYVEVCGEDAKGREIRVLRGRRPTELKLLVNGHNESSGMKSTDLSGTQSSIESSTGFTWPTLANAVYIDRTISDAFLSGTNAQRTAVLSRFQNLERFEKALVLVKKDLKKLEEKYHKVREKLNRYRGSIEECAHSLSELKEIRRVHVRGAYEEYQQTKSRYNRYLKKSKKHKISKKAHIVAKNYEHASKAQAEAERQVHILEETFHAATAWVDKWNHLKEKAYCPTCYQDIDEKIFLKHVKKAEKKAKKLGYELAAAEKSLNMLRLTAHGLEGDHDELQDKLSHVDQEESNLRLSMHTARTQHRELASSQHGAYTIIGKTKSKLRGLKHKKHNLKKSKEKLRRRRVMYEYAAEAFSRAGIPAFLNRQLCPVLNRASEYYAELFSDKEIQVRFKIEGEEFVPEVINSRGGERISDQSEGERALAGLISSFALREAAPECGLLILDEPGSGLDAQTAKQFARSLKVLNKRFKLILVTTHNDHISSALEGEQVLTVRKKHGISHLSRQPILLSGS
jgi:DNA repair exonuclease SbcCD nuclease subunit